MTATEVTLVEAEVSDLEEVMTVMDDSFDPRFGEAWTASQCAGLMAMPGVWLSVARDARGLIGFSLARVIANEAELLLLAVCRYAQRQGVGKMLLDRFAAQARKRGADRLHLEVREGNHAVKLYEGSGFALVGRRRNYYSGPAGQCFDALTLARIETGRD